MSFRLFLLLRTGQVITTLPTSPQTAVEHSPNWLRFQMSKVFQKPVCSSFLGLTIILYGLYISRKGYIGQSWVHTRIFKGDARNLDYGSCGFHQLILIVLPGSDIYHRRCVYMHAGERYMTSHANLAIISMISTPITKRPC